MIPWVITLVILPTFKKLAMSWFLCLENIEAYDLINEWQLRVGAHNMPGTNAAGRLPQSHSCQEQKPLTITVATVISNDTGIKLP